jgi:hypothetical protein
MESYTHNGETISLPVIAPADAPVTAKNVILNHTFETIENHEGGFFRMVMKAPHRKHPDSVRYVQNGKALSLPTILHQNSSLLSSEQRQNKHKQGNDDILPSQE